MQCVCDKHECCMHKSRHEKLANCDITINRSELELGSDG